MAGGYVPRLSWVNLGNGQYATLKPRYYIKKLGPDNWTLIMLGDKHEKHLFTTLKAAQRHADWTYFEQFEMRD